MAGFDPGIVGIFQVSRNSRLESEIQPETDAETDAEFTRKDTPLVTPVRGILKNGYKHDESNANTAAENTFMVEAHQWGTSWQSPTPQFGPGSAELPADLPPPPAYEPPPYE